MLLLLYVFVLFEYEILIVLGAHTVRAAFKLDFDLVNFVEFSL